MGIFEVYGQQKTLTQWDLGRKLIVHEACTQVHYANALAAEALVCNVREEEGVRVAVIPDELLQTSGTLWVYAYLEDGEAYTKHIETIFVKARPKPTDYVYTPTEWMRMEQLAERMDALEDNAETDPTVPAWAKQTQKPTYTATEVGARANTWLPTLTELGAAPAKKAVKGYSLSTGWYRVGTVNVYNCYRVTVSTIWVNRQDMCAIIDVCAPHSNPVLTKTSAAFTSSTVKVIDQVRLVKDGNQYFVDIHYNATASNTVYVQMDGPSGWFEPWEEWTSLGEDGATAAVTLAL